MVTSVFPRFAGDATPPFVLNLARELARRGTEVIVLAPHGVGAAFHERIPVNEAGVPHSCGPGGGPRRPQPIPAEAGTPTSSASCWSSAFTRSRPPEHGFSNPCSHSRTRTSSEERSDDMPKTMSALRWSPAFLRSRRNRKLPHASVDEGAPPALYSRAVRWIGVTGTKRLRRLTHLKT